MGAHAQRVAAAPSRTGSAAELTELWDRRAPACRASLRADGGWRISPFADRSAIAVLIWLATGIYIVAPGRARRRAALRQGGARDRARARTTACPGRSSRCCSPSVTAIRKEEIGFRTVDAGPPARYQEIDDEALMLTGDENIVKLEFIVQYKVRADATGA